jgi:hypothetical protein
MKSIYLKSGLALLMMAALVSCKKDYLETKPTDAASTSTAFTTTGNAMIALNGIHRLLYSQHYSQQDEGGQSANMLYMDNLGEDFVNTTTGNGWLITTYRWTAHRAVSGTVPYFNYAFYYEIIGNANQIIANIDAATGSAADKNLIKGEALAYRGWAYFQMIQLFGKRFVAGSPNDSPGLPLVLTPDLTPLPRSTVAQVYTQINIDLDNAITALTAGSPRPNNSHIGLKVAQGFKARVALAQQNWTVAAAMALAARTGYTPMTNTQLFSGFNDYTNPEWLWGSYQQADQTTYFYSFFAYVSDFNSTNIRTNPKAIFSKLYNTMSATDARRELWDPTGTNTTFPIPAGGIRKPYMSRKFLIKPAGGGLSIGDVPMMRAAEMYLIEAEARARAGGQDAAAAAVFFQLQSKRDPSYVLSTNTGAALINEIMNSRRVELWAEGFRFYDLKRLNAPLDRTGGNHDPAVAVTTAIPAGDKAWEFVIPQAEINANTLVTQNPL